jgi:predicted dehydrogenase
MKTNDRLNRRHFLQGLATSAAALSAPLIIPATALGRGSRPAPSRRVNLAMIGCGGMGTYIDMANFITLPDVEIAAVCDVDADHLEEARLIVEKHERDVLGRSQPNVKAYRNFEEVLARDDIDAVAIATPDHWHAGIAIAAAKAGKDIYGEKPLARTIREGQDMIRVVRRQGVVFQMGTQTRSHGPVQDIIDLLHYGVIGNIQRVDDGTERGAATGTGLRSLARTGAVAPLLPHGRSHELSHGAGLLRRHDHRPRRASLRRRAVGNGP